MKTKCILLVIVLTALVFRVINLGDVPHGLHADEASFLLNSAALMQTQHDEDNRWLPLYLHSIKDPKPALFSYLQIPFLAIFGISIGSARIISALLGVLSIAGVFYLVKLLSRNETIALLTAAIVAVNPWHILLSRSTQEVILSFCLTVWSLYCFVYLLGRNIDTKHRLSFWHELPVIGLFILTGWGAMYSYHATKLFLPPLLMGLAAIQYTKRPDRVTAVKLGLLIGLIWVGFLLSASGAAIRFKAIGILASDLPVAQINDFTANATPVAPYFILRLFYNKVVYYSRFFFDQYFTHFSLNYLFLSGGKTNIHTIPAHGLFYTADLVFLLMGIFALIKSKASSLFTGLIIFSASLAPVAAALTTEDIPSNIRAFMLVLPLSICLAYGFALAWQATKPKLRILVGVVLFGAYGLSVGYFIQQYFIQGPLWHPWYRSRDYDIAAEQVARIAPQYQQILVTNDLREMYIYLWLRGLVSIKDIQNQPRARYLTEYRLGNVMFNNKACDISQADIHTLIVGQPTCKRDHPKELFILKPLTFDDGVPAFNLYVPAAATMSAQKV